MSGIEGITSDMLNYAAKSTTKSGGDMAMDDFLSLIVAQMTNQNMMQPMDDTQFIAQMAQISQLQATQNMMEYSLQSYSASFLGKNVTAIKIDSTGKEVIEQGVVESIQFFNGSPEIVVNGKTFGVANIMMVNNSESSSSDSSTTDKEPETPTTDKTEGAE